LKVTTAELTQVPRSSVAVDAGSAGKVLRLVDALEDLEDVQAVYANYEVSDEVMAAIAAE
jgi:transcriptional/translational regulatory protein YebC/TACO1